MPPAAPRPIYSLADRMLLIAATAGLLALVRACDFTVAFQPIQGAMTVIAVCLCFGGYGACAARWRGRLRYEGFLWGFIFGPLGVLLIALMPRRPEPSEPESVR
jgi:hypothetical protein